MRFIIDRIEGQIAVCENIETKEIVNISIHNLPEEARRDGACIYEENGEYREDKAFEEERRQRIEEKRKLLWGE